MLIWGHKINREKKKQLEKIFTVKLHSRTFVRSLVRSLVRSFVRSFVLTQLRLIER